MEPHEKMQHLLYNLLRKLFIAVGHDVYRGSVFKPYGLTFVMYGLLVVFLCGTVKTVIFYDAVVILNMIPFLALASQVNIFVFVFLSY